MTLSELRTKEVIDVQDGRRLGKVMDLEFSVEDSRITALVVPSETSFLQSLRGRKMRAGHSLGGCTPHRRRCDSGHDPFPPGLRAGLLLLAAGWGIALPAQMEKTCASPAILLHFCSRKPGRQKNRPGFDFLKMKFLIRAYTSAGSSPAGRRLRPARPATGPSAIHPRFSGVYKAL